MKYLTVIIAASMLMGGCGGSDSVKESDPNLVCIGDSVMRRSGDTHRELYGDTCEMIASAFGISTFQNLGIPGASTLEIRRDLQKRGKIDASHIVFASGRNDLRLHLEQGITVGDAHVEAQRVVALIEHVPNIYIWSTWIADSPEEYCPSDSCNFVDQLNSLRQQYWPQYYVPVAETLIGQYDPLEPCEVDGWAKCVIPASLRADSVHLNYAGNLAAIEVMAAPD
jgi:hypothetical protein